LRHRVQTHQMNEYWLKIANDFSYVLVFGFT